MKSKTITKTAGIAAIYACLTYITAGISGGMVQVRIAEALCILPVFTPTAIPALTIGCVLSNLLCGGVIWDVIFGSLATLIGAWGTYALRKTKFLCLLPPIISNAVIIPCVLAFAYGAKGSVFLFMISIFTGELISCGILGYILKSAIEKNKHLKEIIIK